MARKPGKPNLGNPEMPVKAEESEDRNPVALRLPGGWTKVCSVDSQWEIKEELAGQERVVKTYFRVTTEKGEQVTVFRNHVTGGWYRQVDDPGYNAASTR